MDKKEWKRIYNTMIECKLKGAFISPNGLIYKNNKDGTTYYSIKQIKNKL
tara:strand:- start:203 stop:352 length:150 start_codon:yes stop_codon:yes gene_type:complete